MFQTRMKNLLKLFLLSLFSFMVLGTLNSRASAYNGSQSNDPISQISESDGVTEVDVMQAMDASKKASPGLHNDALRVWEKFKSGRVEPNYSYYFWGRNLILWLQKHSNIKFDSQESVAEVFSILHDKKLISADAESVLARFAWKNIERMDNLSLKERAMPQYRIEKKRIFIENLNEVNTQDN